MDKVKTNSLCLPFSRLSVVDTLGKGSFGSVQLVKEKTKGGVAALKTIPKESLSKYMIEIQKQNNDNDDTDHQDSNSKTLGTQALKEITAMKRVCTGQCSGIPRYVGDREDKDNYYILMDSVRGKSLRTIVNEMGPFTDINTIRSILAQILSTISFIHKQGVLHRDLSDNNILVQPNGTVKIIDFGCATLFDPNNIPECSPYTEYPEVDPDDINKKNIIGTLDFIAPEVLVDNCYSEKSDIWSFGVLLFFMVTGHYPFSDDEIDDVYETMYNILENTVIFYDEDDIYEPLYDIFYLCCNPDIHTRVTINELKNHEFFEGIDWNVITLPKSKKKPNLSIHTSLLKNNANAAFLANSNSGNGMMGSNQIYIASPTCLNSPIRINSPSCLYTPLTYGYNTPPLEAPETPAMVASPLVKAANPVMISGSPVHQSPLVKAANPVMLSSSPVHQSPLVKATPVISTSSKIRPSSPIAVPSYPKNETLIFSPKASKLANINSLDNLIKRQASENNYSNPPSNIINGITPSRKPSVNINKNLYNEDYINSPLQQSVLFSPKRHNSEEERNKKNKSIYSSASPVPFTPTSNNNIEPENLGLSSSLKHKNILFSDHDSRNNEFISEVLLNNNKFHPVEINNSESSLEIYHDHKTLLSPSPPPPAPYKHMNRYDVNSDDETKSNCTLIDESEKDFTDQASSLEEESTLILNPMVDSNVYEPTNSSIYKTWDSEHSHILTF